MRFNNLKASSWLLIVALYSLAQFSSADAFCRPALFFYPGPFEAANSDVYFSPVTITAPQAMEAVPNIEELSGVVVMVYWSTLCPTERTCDLGIIDRVINYWAARGKKVVLGVVTFGHPIVQIRDGIEDLQSPTPKWVLRSVATFSQATPVIGPVQIGGRTRYAVSEFPIYWDQKFQYRMDNSNLKRDYND